MYTTCTCLPQKEIFIFVILSANTVLCWFYQILISGDRRGLLWLLDEEAIYPGSSDESFLERLFTHYGDRDHQLLLRKAPGNNQFIIQHLQGTNPVLYSAKGWLKYSRENPVSRSAVSILQESSKYVHICELLFCLNYSITNNLFILTVIILSGPGIICFPQLKRPNYSLF